MSTIPIFRGWLRLAPLIPSYILYLTYGSASRPHCHPPGGGGLEPNVTNGSGATALHSAAANDAWEAAQALLKGGCDHAHKDEDGNTARDAAALRSHSKVAAFLETKVRPLAATAYSKDVD